MTDRGLKIALTVSVLANAFLAAVAVGGAVFFTKALAERADLRQHTPLAVIGQQLDPNVRSSLKQRMRAVALTAAPDFDVAHAARRRAAELAGAPTFDRAAAEAQLVIARAAEERGRGRMESGLLDFMQAQPTATRVVLAKVLRGRTSLHMRPPGAPGGGGPGGQGGPDGPPPSDGGPPPEPPQH